MWIERAIRFINVKTTESQMSAICFWWFQKEMLSRAVHNFITNDSDGCMKLMSSEWTIHCKTQCIKRSISVPTIKIVDERHQKVENQIFYDLGSTIKLKCMVENIVGEQPEYIIWKKGNRMLNYDTERGGIRLLVIWLIWCILLLHFSHSTSPKTSGTFGKLSGTFYTASGICICHTFVSACELIFLQAEPKVGCTLPGQHSPTLATTLAWWVALLRHR